MSFCTVLVFDIISFCNLTDQDSSSIFSKGAFTRLDISHLLPVINVDSFLADLCQSGRLLFSQRSDMKIIRKRIRIFNTAYLIPVLCLRLCLFVCLFCFVFVFLLLLLLFCFLCHINKPALIFCSGLACCAEVLLV